MKTPILETERLILRPLTEEDAPAAFSGWTSDPRVSRFMRWSTHQSVEDTLIWLRDEASQDESDDFYDWGFIWKENGKLIGTGGLVFQPDRGMYELGYNLMYDYWNRGIATEAARRIVAFALDELKQKTLFCCHAKENPASGRVMEKAGFVYQRDGFCSSYDNSKTWETREFLLQH